MNTLSSTDRLPDSNPKRCPVCHGSMNRIPRRFIDLAFILFAPVQRYRCRSMRCNWVGNLPAN